MGLTKSNAVKLSPDVALRGTLIFCLYGYWVVTNQPTARSINTYWGGYFPVLGTILDALLPIGFVIGIITVVILGRYKPFTAILIGALPQITYMALSVGWWVAEFPELNPAAAFTHVSVTLFILISAWRELYVPPHSSG